MPEKRSYFWTYDNPRYGDYRRAKRLLGNVAFVETVAPRTSFVLKRRRGESFADLREALKESLDPRRGSGVLVSRRTGNVFEINNRGNRRNRFIRKA
jgi:hypothetical protein